MVPAQNPAYGRSMALSQPLSAPVAESFGDQLRWWRAQRRLSQLDLAGRAEVSTRHLSFLETGRSRPSREMVVHLAEVLDVPLRERNRMLTGAGFAPVYGERSLDDAALAQVRGALEAVLAGHEPYPAVVVDRHWNLVDANAPASLFLADVAPELLEPPVNVMRLSLHPDGLAPNIENLAQYAQHVLWRLRRQHERTADPVLGALLDEIAGWAPPEAVAVPVGDPGVVLPMRYRYRGEVLDLFSTVAVFGAPLDVTLDDVAIEAFYPADDASAARLRSLAG